MPQQAKAANQNGLQDAFKAAFGQAPPMTRPITSNGVTYTYTLQPLILVRLSGTLFALIVSEDLNGAPHIATGAAAVAYLNLESGTFRPVRVWYEFVQAGSFGMAFIGSASYHFGVPPFFVGEGEYSGMGATTVWYSFIGLYPSGPVNWGLINDAGTLEADSYSLADGDGLTGCGGYAYSSFISAPKRKNDLMQITYTGWMLPGGGAQKRLNFHFSKDVFLTQGKLNLRPKGNIPNCGQ
jgi:hypothetical protein